MRHDARRGDIASIQMFDKSHPNLATVIFMSDLGGKKGENAISRD